MKLKVKSLSLLILIFIPAFIFAQDAIVTGKITDPDTGEALIAANVSIGEKGTYTDVDGTFLISIFPGKHQLTISYIGYKNYEQEITLQRGENPPLNIALSSATTLLNTATITSGKFEKPLSEVTVSLEVLQPSLIHNSGKTSIDQALEKVPGVNIIDGQANIRGGSGFSQGAGSRVLLLVNDIPILQPDSGYPNWDDVPVENIEQVEIVKGAASSLYGSSALNGVINVRTAYAKSTPEFHASIFAKMVDTPKDKRQKWWSSHPSTLGGSFTAKKKFKNTDVVFGTYLQKEDSYHKDTYNDFARFNISLLQRLSDRLSIGLHSNVNMGKSAGYFYWQTDPGETYPTYIGNKATQRERLRFNIDPYLTYFDKSGNRHKVSTRYYRVKNDITDDQSNSSHSYYAEYQFLRRFEEAKLVMTAGVVGRGTDSQADLYGGDKFYSKNYALYTQLDKKLGSRINLSAGFRFEQNYQKNEGYVKPDGTPAPLDEKDSRPVVRFGLNYKIDQKTYLRASWGQGYRYPTIAERFISTNVGFPILPNPELGFETGWSSELAVKRGINFFDMEGFVDIAAFISKYQNMIEFNLSPTAFGFQAINIGDTQILGGEISIATRGQIGQVLVNTTAGYTLIDPTFGEFDDTPFSAGEVPTQGQTNAVNSSADNNVLKYRHRHSAKFDIEGSYKSWSMGLAGFYNSNMEAVDAAFTLIVPGLVEYREKHDKGYYYFDARLAYHISQKAKVSLIADNILNEEYASRPGLLSSPRNFTLRVDVDF